MGNEQKAEKARPHQQATSTPNGQSRFSTVLSRIPPWVKLNLTKPRSLKTLFRCWLASWVALILLLPHASLNVLGTAGFFALLCSFFLPPNLPVQLFLFLMSTLVVGLCFSWGVGVAAMRAANAARSQALLQAAAAKVQASIQNNSVFQANPSLATTAAVFTGVFLDVWSSVVYGCFLAVFAFLFGLMRAYAPKLAFTSIFATIGLDIFCSFGPLFPTAQYTLLKSFIVSIGCYTGLALVFTLVVYPETMSHSALRTVCEQLERVEQAVAIQGEVMTAVQDVPVEDERTGIERLAPGQPLFLKMEGVKTLMTVVMKQLSATSGMLSLEFSVGKWSSDDVRDVIEPLGSIVARSLGLQSFSKLVWRTQELQREAEDGPGSKAAAFNGTSTVTSISTKNSAAPSNDAYLLQQIVSLNKEFEASHHLSVVDVMPLIESATLELREAITAGAVAMRKNLDNINHRRWTKKADIDSQLRQELDGAYERLTTALKNFTQDGQDATRMQILGPFIALLHSEMTKIEQESLPFRSLFIAFVLGTNLVSLSESILKTMDVVRTTVGKRTNNRLWAPRGLRQIGKLFRVKGVGEDENGVALGENVGGQVIGEDGVEEAGTKDYKLDPDSRPPTNVLQKIMNKLHGLYQWCGTPEAIFGFKYAFVSVAIWIPAVVSTTAGFYYEQKGLWALIMAQTTMNVYAADQVFNLVVRIMGTVVGAVLGLATWYMGNGHGIGNPYGGAAAAALFLLPVQFFRNFAPPQALPGVLLGCATFALVVGYSWVDGHVVQFASPGIGWSVAWKRFTLVIIGSAASFIVMILPPTSVRKVVRRRNASVISGLGNLYAFLMSSWIAQDAHDSDDESDLGASADGDGVESKNANGDQDGNTTKADIETASLSTHERTTPSARWVNAFRTRLLGLSEEIGGLKQLMATATWEGNIRGKWPAEEYTALIGAETEMLVGLAQLGTALAHLDDDWRIQFIHNTRVLNPHFITEVMAVISLISQSLRTGEPLHQVLPQNLVGRLLYHHNNHNYLHEPSASSHANRHAKHYLSEETVTSLDYMYYATGIMAVFLVLNSIDELQKITRRLCGEVPFRGFEDWRSRFDSEHISSRL